MKRKTVLRLSFVLFSMTFDPNRFDPSTWGKPFNLFFWRGRTTQGKRCFHFLGIENLAKFNPKKERKNSRNYTRKTPPKKNPQFLCWKMAKYRQGKKKKKKKKNITCVALFSCISCGVKCHIIYLAIKKNAGNICQAQAGDSGTGPIHSKFSRAFNNPCLLRVVFSTRSFDGCPQASSSRLSSLVLCLRNLSLPKTRSIRKPQCTTPFPSHFVARNCCWSRGWSWFYIFKKKLGFRQALAAGSSNRIEAMELENLVDSGRRTIISSTRSGWMSQQERHCEQGYVIVQEKKNLFQKSFSVWEKETERQAEED